jgi:hypothetical protein
MSHTEKLNLYFENLFQKYPQLSDNAENRYFIQWLLGFFNRRGQFNGTKFILQHNQDKKLLQLISNKLKAGRVFELDGIYLEFSKLDDLNLLISILNPFIFENSKLKSFEKFLTRTNPKETKEKSIPLNLANIQLLNENQFFEAFLMGFLEAGEPPFSFNYSRKGLKFLPTIVIASLNKKKYPNLLKEIFKILDEKNKSNQNSTSAKNLQLLDDFKAKLVETNYCYNTILIQIIKKNKFLGKKQESFNNFLKLIDKIEAFEFLEKYQKIKSFENLRKEITKYHNIFNYPYLHPSLRKSCPPFFIEY